MLKRSASAVTLIVVISISRFGHAEFGDELFTLVPALGDREPVAGQEFGGAASLEGSFVIVAAEEDPFVGQEAGAVWVFDVTNGNPLRFLEPANLDAFDGLGESVDLNNGVAVITADAKNEERGVAYLFDVATGNELRFFAPEDLMPGDEFGQTAGISGNLLLVGAENADSGQGAGYVFDLTTGEQMHRLSINDPTVKGIGNECAIGGNHILLGGGNDDAVYLFDATSGDMRKKLFSAVENSGFGSSIAIDGKWGLIGSDEEDDDAGVAYLVDLESTEIKLKYMADDRAPGDEFGDTVAIDGDLVFVSAGEVGDDAGAVYIFDRMTGIQLIRLTPQGLKADDKFGSSISSDNGIVVIGADDDLTPEGIRSGLAYLFNVNTTELADVNDDGVVDVADIDDLSQAFASGSEDLSFDLNHNGVVDGRDREVWVRALQHTYFGDANLDGVFNNDDFVTVFVAGEYEDDAAGNSGWSEGDWDGDGDFTSGDIVAVFIAGGYLQTPRESATAVPEPTGLIVALLAMPSLWNRCRRSPRVS